MFEVGSPEGLKKKNEGNVCRLAGINPESFHSKTMTSTFLRVSFKGPFAKSVSVVSVESPDIGKTLLLLLLGPLFRTCVLKSLT